MRAVWAQRQEELLSDCVVSPYVFDHMVDRLCDFAALYQHCLETEAAQRNVQLYLAGLLSDLDRKNAEEIAALVDVERLVIQAFIGTAPWDHQQSPRSLRRNSHQGRPLSSHCCGAKLRAFSPQILE